MCLFDSKEPGQTRVRRWGFGIDEVLKDPVGREQFLKFLESEFSSENLRYVHGPPHAPCWFWHVLHHCRMVLPTNHHLHFSFKFFLRFWLAVQELKRRTIREVPLRVQEIWEEFLAPGAPSAINVDSKSYDKTTQNVKDPGRYTFEDAQVNVWYWKWI